MNRTILIWLCVGFVGAMASSFGECSAMEKKWTKYGPGIYVMPVPGGWMFTATGAGTALTFVPDPRVHKESDSHAAAELDALIAGEKGE